MERALPESGKGLADWWGRHGTHDHFWASQTNAELVDNAGPVGERHAAAEYPTTAN